MQKMFFSVLLVLLLILVPHLHCLTFLRLRSRPRRRLRVESKSNFLLLRIAGTTILWPLHICVARGDEGWRRATGEAEERRKKDKGKFLGLLPVLLLVLVPFGAAHLCQATIRFYCAFLLSPFLSPRVSGVTTTWSCGW